MEHFSAREQMDEMIIRRDFLQQRLDFLEHRNSRFNSVDLNKLREANRNRAQAAILEEINERCRRIYALKQMIGNANDQILLLETKVSRQSPVTYFPQTSEHPQHSSHRPFSEAERKRKKGPVLPKQVNSKPIPGAFHAHIHPDIAAELGIRNPYEYPRDYPLTIAQPDSQDLAAIIGGVDMVQESGVSNVNQSSIKQS